MIRELWNKTLASATQLTAEPRYAARLANLGIAAASAYKRGLLRGSADPCHERQRLRDVMHELALYELPELSNDSAGWTALAKNASWFASDLNGALSMDRWIESWQASDAGRKTKGAYATPSPFAHSLAHAVVRDLPRTRRALRIVDPSAGAGSLLAEIYRVLSADLHGAARGGILRSLYGMEIDPSARELCCLVLWLLGGSSLHDLFEIAKNIKVADAITYDWWSNGFGSGFDILVMNPPWESLRHAVASNDLQASSRSATIARLCKQQPGAAGLPLLFSAQGRGDRNLFKAFMELAPHLLREGGRYGALIPGAFASDYGMAPLRQRYFEQLEIDTWTGFENLRRYFLIDSRYKFGILIGTRSGTGTKALRVRSFSFNPEEINAPHATVTVEELAKLGGPAHMLPELTDNEEKDTLMHALSYGSPFFGSGSLGQVRYKRELDLTFGLRNRDFRRLRRNEALHLGSDALFVVRRNKQVVPVLEGRMVGQYDFFQKSWINGHGRTASWEMNGTRALADCRPQFVTTPRQQEAPPRLALCDVTSATNSRTVHATWVPDKWRCGNTAPVLEFDTSANALAGLGILNSMVFDWITRRLVAGLHLNKFYLASLCWPSLSKQEVSLLAIAAAVLCARNPRFQAAGGRDFLRTAGVRSTRGSVVEALATIDVVVARGFRLKHQMLRKIYSTDRNDRRGFWRYFAQHSLALDVAGRVLELYKGPNADRLSA